MKFSSKEEVRRYVWNILKEKKVCSFPCEGHIPNFLGVEETIKKVLELDEYRRAKRIFISPDTPQRYLLKHVINDKEVYMATPRLRRGFCKVEEYYGSLRDIIKNSKIVGYNIPEIGFALIGSVAVDLKGNRIGKGGGFGDREIRILREKNPSIIIATNVHDLQVFEDLSYLMEDYDQKINMIITTKGVFRVL